LKKEREINFPLSYTDKTGKKFTLTTIILKALDIFESYCEIWRLQVNVAKTKVTIFRKRKTAQDPKFIYMVKRLILLIHTHILG
jgi:hypothetical protein